MNQAHTPSRGLALLALAVSCLGVGSAVIFVRLSEVDPSATLMLRMFFASLIIGALNVVSRPARSSTESPRRSGLYALLFLSSVLFCLDLLANHWAVRYTSVTNTVLLANVAPIFVAALAFFVFGERLSMAQLGSLAVAVLGATILVTDGPPTFPGANHLIGAGLALLSSALYAVYLIMTKSLRDHFGANTIMYWNSVIAAVMLLPVVLATSDPILPQTLLGYGMVIMLAIASQLLGHGLMTYALRHVPTGFAAASTLATPVISALLAWMFLSEPMTLQQGAGAALILGGLYIYSNPNLLHKR